MWHLSTKLEKNHWKLYGAACLTIKNFYRVADKVLIGNEVLVQENNELTSAMVTNISESKMQGENYFFNMCIYSQVSVTLH